MLLTPLAVDRYKPHVALSRARAFRVRMNSITNNPSLIADTKVGLVLVALITHIGLLIRSFSGAGLVRVKS
jgi:hypothetical protein